MTFIKIICSVCGKDMGIKDGKGSTGISHSFCPICYKKQLEELEKLDLTTSRSFENRSRRKSTPTISS
jgi:ssDNA-binding Zn-finger/Zn-ribbon topoisomerase 1